MAKRFTDTELWEHEWFLELNETAKLLWFFLERKCDHAGFWKVNRPLLQTYLGKKIDLVKCIEMFKGRVIFVNSDTIYLKNFIKFQHGELNENNNAHKGVLKILRKYDMLGENNKPLTSPKDAPSVIPLEGAQVMLKVKVKDKVKLNKGDALEVNDQDFNFVYALYPRKEGKQLGYKKFKKQITTKKIFQDFKTSVENYVKKIENENIERKYILKFSNFMDNWQDYLEIEIEKDWYDEAFEFLDKVE